MKQIIIDRRRVAYAVARTGAVFSLRTGQKLKPQIDKGYLVVWLALGNGRRRKCRVHRLVARAYLVNRGRKPFVDHRDGDKLNCDLTNLRWATVSENTQYAVAQGRIKSGRIRPATPLVAMPLSPRDPGHWFPSTRALKDGGFCRRSVHRVIAGEQSTHKNLKWEAMSHVA